MRLPRVREDCTNLDIPRGPRHAIQATDSHNPGLEDWTRRPTEALTAPTVALRLLNAYSVGLKREGASVEKSMVSIRSVRA